MRQAIRQNTDLGKEAKSFVESGALVPDSLVTRMVTLRLLADDVKNGFILDGFPRNVAQAGELDEFLGKEGRSDYSVIYLDTSEKIIVQRLGGRRICRNCQAVYHLTNRPPKKDMSCDNCQGQLYQRPDDKEDTIKNRLEVYGKETQPVEEYYSRNKRLFTVNADKDSGIVLGRCWISCGRDDSHKVSFGSGGNAPGRISPGEDNGQTARFYKGRHIYPGD